MFNHNAMITSCSNHYVLITPWSNHSCKSHHLIWGMSLSHSFVVCCVFKWTVHFILWSAQFQTFEPLTFVLLDRPFQTFEPSIFPPGTVQFDTNDRPLWPRSFHFSSKDRPLSSRTVHFGSNYCPRYFYCIMCMYFVENVIW